VMRLIHINNRDEKNPIIDLGPEGSWEDRHVACAAVLKEKADKIGASSPDQGPICLATAEKPEGPWKKYEGNPVIPAGDWGAWDDGGYSEAGVIHRDGVFHIRHFAW